jgi:hypothetical protein
VQNSSGFSWASCVITSSAEHERHASTPSSSTSSASEQSTSSHSPSPVTRPPNPSPHVEHQPSDQDPPESQPPQPTLEHRSQPQTSCRQQKSIILWAWHAPLPNPTPNRHYAAISRNRDIAEA